MIRRLQPSCWRKPVFQRARAFPKIVLYTRGAGPGQLNAAEAIAAMLKDNLGIQVEVQDLDYKIFMDMLRNQKKNKGGDMQLAMVSYEFDFVDGSNLLSVWGGCELEGGFRNPVATPGITSSSTNCGVRPGRSRATRPSVTICTSRLKRF